MLITFHIGQGIIAKLIFPKNLSNCVIYWLIKIDVNDVSLDSDFLKSISPPQYKYTYYIFGFLHSIEWRERGHFIVSTQSNSLNQYIFLN